MESVPIHFIDESVEVVFDRPPMLEKKPECPNGFIWRGETFHIVELLSAWVDNERRGRMARNMAPEHAARASVRGSWGVGRFFFRVVVDGGRIFDLYYDRAPKDSAHRKGAWFLKAEREAAGPKP